MFALSDHAQVRAKQRGIRSEDILFVCEHGTQTERGYLLTARDAQDLEQAARELMRRAERLKGVLVPVSEGVAKTAFKASRKQRRRLR